MFIDTIMSSLSQVDGMFSTIFCHIKERVIIRDVLKCMYILADEVAVLLCECLSAISSLQNDLLKSLVSDIVEILQACEDRPRLTVGTLV